MGSPLIKKEILDQLSKLGAEQQRQVLDFARSLAKIKPKGVSGKELLSFAGTIGSDDLQAIAQAIEEGCERVDMSEW